MFLIETVVYHGFFFFFQAEDGIRDHCVTGVQTCALPILAGGWGVVTTSMLEFEADQGPEVDAVEGYLLAVPRALAARVAVDARDRYYRNADLDYSFAVRDLGYSIHRGTRRGSSGPLRAYR